MFKLLNWYGSIEGSVKSVESNELNILYFARTMKLGGTENVILQLCEIMRGEANKIIVCSCGGVNVKKLNAMGIKHYEIPDIEEKNMSTIVEVLRSVSGIIRKENITVMHTHHRMAAFYTRLLSLKHKFVFINTAHNTFNDKKSLTRFSYRKANLIAVGNKVKENLYEFYGLPNEQITVIHNSIIPFDGKIKPIEIIAEYRKEGYFLVGNIGRISKQKGMEYFVKAMPKVLKEYPKVKFFIVGEGEERDKIEKLINEMQLSENIILLGYREDIQNVMSQFDLIVLSSLWEGLPLTPIEAFCVGKTIIATSVDGTVEIVEDGYNGMLVEPYNSDMISDKILTLIKDKDKRNELEKNALITYRHRFDFEILKKEYLSYYKSI